MNLRTLLPITLGALAVTSLAACGSDDPGDGLQVGFLISADTAAATTLGTAPTFTARLVSVDFAGSVGLEVTGAPPSWTVSLADSVVTLAPNDTVSVLVTVAIPSNGAAAAAGQTITVHATAGELARSADTRLTVADEFVIHLLAGASAGPHWSAAAHGPHLNVGTTLTIRNDDTTGHIIHSNITGLGFPHQEIGGVGIPPGGTYSAALTSVGAGTIACHSHSHADTLGVIVP